MSLTSENIKEKVKVVEKVTKQLVFDKFNIPFDIKPEYSSYEDSWYLNFWIDVDVDRYVSFTKRFDSDYEIYMNNIAKRIEQALRYINLNSYFGGVLYDYYNDTEVDEAMNNLTSQLHRDLENKYNVRPHEIEKASIYYYLHKPDDDYLFMKIALIGDSIVVENDETGELTELVDCKELENMMLDLVDDVISYDVESMVCQ